MKLLNYKVLLPILCSLALIVSVFGAVMASGIQAASTAESGECELDKILERDGYLEGIMFPWFTHAFLGHGLSGNDLLAETMSSSWANVGLHQWGTTKIYREIYNLKALGFNIMGYEGSPYGEGVIYDKNGDVLGIKDEYIDNLRIFLDICREVDMPIAWTVTFHSTTLNSYYGEKGKDAWDLIAQAYANPTVADHYAERFVKPLCDVLNEYKDVVVLMVSSVELENEINDSEIGNHFEGPRAQYGTNQENMLYFINAVTEAVKEKMPNVPRTMAANTKDMTIYEDIDFTYLGINNYNINARVPDIESMKSNKPMIGTEFGFGDGVEMEDEIWTLKQVRFRKNFINNGYIGWFMWCWSATGYGGAYDLLKAGGLSTTDFRSGAFAIKYNADNYRAAHRGEKVTLTAPVLFCNTGSGSVEWVASPQADTITLERSTDGGKTWKKLLDKVDPLEVQESTGQPLEQDFKGTYIDEEIAKCTTGGKVCYRVTAHKDDGSKAVSEVNNEAEILGPPINVVEGLNHSFEDGMEYWVDWGTNAATSEDGSGNFFAQAVKLEDAPDGEYAMELKFLDKEWFGVCNTGITVKPNTNYVLRYTYKIADPVDFMTGYCFVRGYNPNDSKGEGNKLGDINDATLTSLYLNHGSSTEWTTEEVSFKTNDSDKLGIDFRVITGVHYYIDDVQLIEVR